MAPAWGVFLGSFQQQRHFLLQWFSFKGKEKKTLPTALNARGSPSAASLAFQFSFLILPTNSSVGLSSLNFQTLQFERSFFSVALQSVLHPVPTPTSYPRIESHLLMCAHVQMRVTEEFAKYPSSWLLIWFIHLLLIQKRHYETCTHLEMYMRIFVIHDKHE